MAAFVKADAAGFDDYVVGVCQPYREVTASVSLQAALEVALGDVDEGELFAVDVVAVEVHWGVAVGCCLALVLEELLVGG